THSRLRRNFRRASRQPKAHVERRMGKAEADAARVNYSAVEAAESTRLSAESAGQRDRCRSTKGDRGSAKSTRTIGSTDDGRQSPVASRQSPVAGDWRPATGDRLDQSLRLRPVGLSSAINGSGSIEIR